MSPDFPPGFAPNFADPVLHSEAPQVCINALLESLSDTWTPISPATDGDEMAVGCLVLADGIQVREGASGPEARLTISGARWKNVLLANRHMPVQARCAVLTFIWDQCQERKATAPRTAPPEALTAGKAPEGEYKSAEAPAEVPELVTLDQAAALVNRSARTLERYKKRGLPRPFVLGGGGKPHEYRLDEMREWLQKTFKRPIPEATIQRFRHPKTI